MRRYGGVDRGGARRTLWGAGQGTRRRCRARATHVPPCTAAQSASPGCPAAPRAKTGATACDRNVPAQGGQELEGSLHVSKQARQKDSPRGGNCAHVGARARVEKGVAARYRHCGTVWLHPGFNTLALSALRAHGCTASRPARTPRCRWRRRRSAQRGSACVAQHERPVCQGLCVHPATPAHTCAASHATLLAATRTAIWRPSH